MMITDDSTAGAIPAPHGEWRISASPWVATRHQSQERGRPMGHDKLTLARPSRRVAMVRRRTYATTCRHSKQAHVGSRAWPKRGTDRGWSGCDTNHSPEVIPAESTDLQQRSTRHRNGVTTRRVLVARSRRRAGGEAGCPRAHRVKGGGTYIGQDFDGCKHTLAMLPAINP